ncbi:MAG: hypothetical protein GY937_20505 [bacterium]|nr:hypothetical protein [bacterium]
MSSAPTPTIPPLLGRSPEALPDKTGTLDGESVARHPRLESLRRDLLAAPYALCTQKAELMTEYFRDHVPGDPVVRILSHLHFALTRRGLERSLGSGSAQPRWLLRASRSLQRFYARRLDSVAGEPLIVHHSRALAHVLERVPLRIYEHELLVGNPSSQRIGAPIHPDLGGILMLPELETLSTRAVNPIECSQEQQQRLTREILPFWFPRSVQSRAAVLAQDPELPNALLRGDRYVLTQFAGISHVTPDYPSILEHGFQGILEQIETARSDARTPEQEAFFEAGSIAARAAIAFGARWSEHCAEEATRQTDPRRAAELRRLADIFRQVPARPARSFYEAVQSMLLTHVMVHQESFQHGISFGRIDRYLHPYYVRDLADGRVTRDEAIEILGCFLGKAAELLPLFNEMATEYFSGLSSASGITLGGMDEHGCDASNEISLLVLEAYDQMRLRQPNLHARIHPESPKEFVDLAHDVVKRGGGMPAFFNDEAIVPSIERLDVPTHDARDYAIVGCVEWGVPRKSFPAAGACFLSLPSALQRALREIPRVGQGVSPGALDSMESIFATLSTEVEQLVAEAADGNDAIECAHARWRPTPLLSLLVQGCIGSGRDVTAGGARYDSTGMQGVGIADVADSLAAIEQLVSVEKRLSFGELLAAADGDFVEAPELCRRLQDRVPRYGSDAGRAEHWANRVSDIYCEAVRHRRNPRGGPYAPGFWTMTTHIGFGRRLGALPSGRRAGQPLSDGVSPANGADRNGPTASLLAATRTQSPAVGNGLCLNEKIEPWFVEGDAGTALLADLTRGYFRAGGMQVQYNVVDPQVLLDAKVHPERHRDLVVRISGYSAYFNDLTDAMKDDIIARALHGGQTPPGNGRGACA